MRDGRRVRFLLFAVAVMAVTGVFAFQPVPKESAKALGRTRGKPFSLGAVFVNGKYLEPPYVVERWGTGIRINQMPVTGQIVDWNEFLKTQPDVKVEKKESEPAPSEPAPAEPAATQPDAAVSIEAATSSLDDLFDDDPKSKKPEAAEPVAAPPPVPPPAPKPAKPVVTYALNGEFKHNADSKALLNRVNAARTEIDRALRSGGFICFGDSYSQVQGDRRTLIEMLEALPELLQNSSDVQDFSSKVRAANLIYLNEPLCRDLYRNRTDYRKLKERRGKFKSAQKWNRILEEASDPIL